jgi:hypothetical protein
MVVIEDVYTLTVVVLSFSRSLSCSIATEVRKAYLKLDTVGLVRDPGRCLDSGSGLEHTSYVNGCLIREIDSWMMIPRLSFLPVFAAVTSNRYVVCLDPPQSLNQIELYTNVT